MNNLRIAVAALSALAMSIPSTATAGDRTSYVLFSPGSESISMSGSTDDISRARAFRRGSEALLYVRENGAAYVIRDPATLAQAQELFRPEEELGARQGELGQRQGELGRRQGELGAQQGELGRQQGELGREQARLAQIAQEKLQVLVAEAIRRGLAQRVD